MSIEIMEKLKLFVKSPNSVHNVGEEREKWVPNPKANSLTDLDNFYRLGLAMAIVFKMRECIEINVTSLLWKYIRSKIGLTQAAELVWEDYVIVNVNQYNCIEKIALMNDEDLEYLDLTFTTHLNDGQEYELEPEGRSRQVNADNKTEYVQKCIQIHLAHLKKPFDYIRRGFVDNIWQCNYVLMTASHLEKTICGMDYVDTQVLKTITRYSGFPGEPAEHQTVVWFWKIINSMTQEQLAGYLRYVWGRSRLSHNFGDSHKLTFVKGKANIPEAHTCFFELDIGEYPSEEDLRKKLLYGIENCTFIAESSRQFKFSADFGL